ncbi:hypothetical protein DES53_104358 [Roseimicrobium gellanilyticum]|uniref:Uncharacterized protein n=1 Tax=Roseimicrobium gellanilyticum TaxID=748857 RepID=A0A366HN03_9BACT|nr:hypothetical protein DES53_104358 [Roseimicrobium gellanilyticum]
MSEDFSSEKHGSRWLSWVLATVAALLLYLLAAPPLLFGLISDWGKRRPQAPEAWMTPFVMPYQWLLDHTPLRGPLTNYSRWWGQKFFGKHITPSPSSTPPPSSAPAPP